MLGKLDFHNFNEPECLGWRIQGVRNDAQGRGKVTRSVSANARTSNKFVLFVRRDGGIRLSHLISTILGRLQM
jgi:hypothetical protein